MVKIMPKIFIKSSRNKQVIDITGTVNGLIRKQGWRDGLCALHVLHTTCALTTADLDPGTDLDMLDAFEEMIPKLKYRHPHDPSHVGEHIMSSIIGSSLTIPIQDGSFILGTWQRVVLVELSGPRERAVLVSHLKED